MGAEGSIHIFTIKDLDAMTQLNTRFGVHAYVYENFLREGLHVAWEFRGDCPDEVGENIEAIYSALLFVHPDQHPEWKEMNFKEWVESQPRMGWWGRSMQGVDDTATVRDFLDIWNRAIGDYEGEYEVWT